MSNLPSGPDLPFLDKVGHFILYAILGAALGWWRSEAGPAAPHWALLALGWMYGAIDEWHQSFVPRRSPDLWDLGVDILGVTFGYALLLFLLRTMNPTRDDRRST